MRDRGAVLRDVPGLDLDAIEVEIRRATDPPDARVPVLYAAARLGHVLLAELRETRARIEARDELIRQALMIFADETVPPEAAGVLMADALRGIA